MAWPRAWSVGSAARTLIHHYFADEDGKLLRVNLIVATGHNNWAMSQAVDAVAKTSITGPEIREGLLDRVEAAVRLTIRACRARRTRSGRMPMVIEMLDPAGARWCRRCGAMGRRLARNGGYADPGLRQHRPHG